jgi:hypothetical protein
MVEEKKVIGQEEFGRENEVFEQQWVHDRDGRFCPGCLESAEASWRWTLIGPAVQLRNRFRSLSHENLGGLKRQAGEILG